MPTDPEPARVQWRPGPDFDQQAIPSTRQPQRGWFRIHKTGSPAIRFGNSPFHRFSHPDCQFHWLYVGASVQTCLWEVFGDELFETRHAISAGKWRGCCASRLMVPEMKVCAVNLERTRAALGVDKASLLSADLQIPQAWGLAIQNHPARFEAIKYSSRFLDQPCLAILDRDGMASRLQVKLLGPITELEVAVDWLEDRKAALV